MLYSNEESQQRLLIKWASLIPFIGDYLIHPANQGKRRGMTGKNFKRMGVKAGVSDLFLAKPCNGFHGLWLEMKYGKGKLSDEQKSWQDKMRVQGYQAKTAYSCEEAKDIILSYLDLNNKSTV